MKSSTSMLDFVRTFRNSLFSSSVKNAVTRCYILIYAKLYNVNKKKNIYIYMYIIYIFNFSL